MKYLLVLPFICISISLYSQPKTYLGVETGPAWDLTPVKERGEDLLFPSHSTGMVNGISFSQDFLGGLAISTGLSIHTYQSGININGNRRFQPEYPLYTSINIPVRIILRIPMKDIPLSISPRLGYHRGIILSESTPVSFSSTINDTENKRFSYTYESFNPTVEQFHMIETGIAADYRFDNNCQLSLIFSHYNGLINVAESSLSYTYIGDNESTTATYDIEGARMQTVLSVQMPVSNLWQKRDIRLHRRIEQSTSRGAGLRNKNQYYLGMEVSSLWRTFTNSNPAIGSRSVMNLNPFLFANLHTGIHAGIRFPGNAGIDIGGYYQRSSAFFTLSYNTDEEFVVKSSAPFFLEIPLHLRYFYHIYESDFTFIPSLGISMLTHFATTEYQGSDSDFPYNSTGMATLESYNYSGSRLNRFGITANTCIAMEYKLPIAFNMNVYLDASYKFGYRSLDQLHITTTVEGENHESAITYNGTGWRLALGTRIPIIPGQKKCGSEKRIRK